MTHLPRFAYTTIFHVVPHYQKLVGNLSEVNFLDFRVDML